MVSPRRALLSVSEKEGLVEFARGLRDLGFEFIATEGTAKALQEAGIAAATVAEYTGLREGLGGRVKTLHPRIFAGILAPRGDERDLADLGAVAIDLVVANLYPFEATVAKPHVTMAEAIENIDIGGVSLIRAAAKNAARVAVIVRPSRYPDVLRALQDQKTVPQRLRDELAVEAFEYTSRYDAAIFNYLAKRQGATLPPALRLAYDKIADLRYGENPYQKAALYRESFPSAATANAEKLQGKDLSYNNLIDLDAALRIVSEFDRPAAVVIKHTNPAGAALSSDLESAYEAAHACDPISAYGGVVGLNRTVDLPTEGDAKGRPGRRHRARIRAAGARDPPAEEEGRLPDHADARRTPEGPRRRHGPHPRRRPPPDDGLPRAEARGVQGGHEGIADRGPDAGHPVRDHREPLREVELDRPRERRPHGRDRRRPDEPGGRMYDRAPQGQGRGARERRGERRVLPLP